MRKTMAQKKQNRYRIWLVGMLTGVLMCGLVGCGSDSSKALDTAASQNTSAVYDDYEMKESVTEDAGVAEQPETDGAAMEDGAFDETAQTDEKIIYTYNYTVETKQFDTFMETVEERIGTYGGYVESSETNGNADRNLRRYANMVIRIPTAKMKAFLSMVEETSNVTYAVRSSENVTLSYVDLESHIKALKIEQETLLGLLEQAKKLEDILTLQSQLTDVRYQLESYESQLRVYDNRIDYATLYLDINEVERETTVADKLSYGEEIRQGLSDTFYELGQGLRGFSIWFIVHLPFLLLWAAILAVVLWLVFHISKRCAKKRDTQRKRWGKRLHEELKLSDENDKENAKK